MHLLINVNIGWYFFLFKDLMIILLLPSWVNILIFDHVFGLLGSIFTVIAVLLIILIAFIKTWKNKWEFLTMDLKSKNISRIAIPLSMLVIYFQTFFIILFRGNKLLQSLSMAILQVINFLPNILAMKIFIKKYIYLNIRDFCLNTLITFSFFLMIFGKNIIF